MGLQDRPIFFSNEYPAAHENYPPFGQKGVYNSTWMADTHGAAMGAHANMWRTAVDIGAQWRSILKNIDFDEVWAEFAKPGSINDPDMLVVGDGMPLTASILDCTLLVDLFFFFSSFFFSSSFLLLVCVCVGGALSRTFPLHTEPHRTATA